ncbi:hypothetical protein CH63R_09543 [Colletotrichum higginsianum IMI 349063]|uniref:Uncharacterized protein n=1 Tax=Colletotrichum higginsianum (strain IMI 349063) TaxID=759273 RepID=A0A1B7Y7J0_COLHI|nr:hypothetical protein CH63R_09543 [Colletotrichum higginsianum IMI 349063]OBR08022.1 hypothetical protein CH63R_09543 [Colletotrichum higginsianum IMI 349063]
MSDLVALPGKMNRTAPLWPRSTSPNEAAVASQTSEHRVGGGHVNSQRPQRSSGLGINPMPSGCRPISRATTDCPDSKPARQSPQLSYLGCVQKSPVARSQDAEQQGTPGRSERSDRLCGGSEGGGGGGGS